MVKLSSLNRIFNKSDDQINKKSAIINTMELYKNVYSEALNMNSDYKPLEYNENDKKIIN